MGNFNSKKEDWRRTLGTQTPLEGDGFDNNALVLVLCCLITIMERRYWCTGVLVYWCIGVLLRFLNTVYENPVVIFMRFSRLGYEILVPVLFIIILYQFQRFFVLPVHIYIIMFLMLNI
jgi:hypothetical protein